MYGEMNRSLLLSVIVSFLAAPFFSYAQVSRLYLQQNANAGKIPLLNEFRSNQKLLSQLDQWANGYVEYAEKNKHTPGYCDEVRTAAEDNIDFEQSQEGLDVRFRVNILRDKRVDPKIVNDHDLTQLSQSINKGLNVSANEIGVKFYVSFFITENDVRRQLWP